MKPGDDSKSAEAATSHDGSAAPPRSERPQRQSQRPGGAVSLIGMTLSGRYRIEKLLGEGGMGAVYQAEHTHMRKRLAVKVLHPEMSRLPEVVARFEREAMAAAHIDHPNVATATDFGKLEDGSFFLALEFVEGRSLREDLGKAGRLELGRALHITHQIAMGLQRAHTLGIVHRDLKPENVMLVEREGDPDFVKILDFGIAKVPVGALSSPASSPLSGGPAQPVLTQLGMVYGTPEYMAPEQALGQPIDARADLYSLGVMTYEMLAGSRPFEHESKVSLLGMHVTARVPPFAERCPDAMVPPEVEAIVMRLLKKEATDRYADARELSEAIAAVLVLLVERQTIDTRFGALLGPQVSSPNLASLSGAGPLSRLGTGLGRQPSYPLGTAPTVLPTGSGIVEAPARDRRRTLAVLAAALGGLSVFAVVAVLFAGRASKGDLLVQPDGAVVVVPEAPKVKSNEDEIAAALSDIEKGDYGSGIASLTAVEGRDVDRPDVHRALVRAYLATRDVKSAMKEAGLLFKSDPSAVGEPKLQEDVRNAAVGKDAPDDAFELLETGMGSVGTELLYDIAYAQWASEYPRSASRATKLLSRADIRAKATPTLMLTLEMRSAPTCDAKKAKLDRARDVGDWRTAALLRSYLTTKGCGFLGARDCWTCMHKDGSLAKTVAAIEEKPKK
jgi:serine/threonine protein kinase